MKLLRRLLAPPPAQKFTSRGSSTLVVSLAHKSGKLRPLEPNFVPPTPTVSPPENIMRKIAEEQAKRFFGRVWEDTIGYVRLYEFLKLRAAAALTDRAIELSSVAEFWHGLLGDRFCDHSLRYQPIRDGQIIRFHRGFATEWGPKLAGQLWTAEGAAERAAGLKSVEGTRQYGEETYVILDPYGKQRVLNAGHGSVRLPTGPNDGDHFACLALVDDEERWNCDYGVPLVVSKPVYDAFYRHALHGAPAVEFLEGIVRIGTDLPFSQLIPRAIGAALSKESEDVLRLRPGLPRCYIHVVSPLSVRFLYNDSHPNITAWTMYATSAPQMRSRQPAYGYSYVTLNPKIEGAHEEAATFLREYANDHGGDRLVTDYDGVVPRLAAEIPLTQDPMSKKSAVKKLVVGLDQWIQKVIQNFDHDR